ncbi:unnamed protein product [Symbiodinium sp. CCMP2592]|nr:unnamed protein product [Symbiodinium sp. CCMP2592]
MDVPPPPAEVLQPPPPNDRAKMPDLRLQYLLWGQQSYPDFTPECSQLVAMAKYVCDMDAANYMMSNKQKLMLAMLIDGDSWRAHCRQAFHYKDGAWVRADSLYLDAWEILMALEGLFVQMSLDVEAAGHQVEWTWTSASFHIVQIIRGLMQGTETVIKTLCGVAKTNSDHVRKATSNKTWHAQWSRRVADMLAQYRKTWENEFLSKPLSKLFLVEWDAPLPRSKGVCFLDVFLDENWEIAPKSRDHNCYLKLNYHFLYEQVVAQDPSIDVEDYRRRLRSFLESLYYENAHAFEIKLCFLHAAFKRVCTSKMIFQIGKGGDGKGMEAILDRALFGDLASSTLDCGVFLDRGEFRKSAELAWNAANVRIQEMDQRAHFHADIWKRFVVNEDIDCRVNYGFTTKRRFGDSLKVQELNYDNIPVIEEARDRNKSCQQLERRVVCVRMGKGKFTAAENEVDPEKGVFLLLSQEELSSLLSHEVTAALYLREYCIPFFQETSLEEALNMINNLGEVHADLLSDTKWLASRLAGGNAPPPGEGVCDLSENNDTVIAAHSQTPWKRTIREYLIHKIESLPGAISSSKGKRTKLSHLIEAVDHVDVLLLKQVDHSTFHKLLIDWQRLVPAMEANGGSAVFGTWAQWSDPFDLLHLQEKWTGSAFQHDAQMIRQNKSLSEDLAFLGRLSEARLHEKINLSALEAYARARTDRRQDLLDAYITRHRRDGFSHGDYSTIEVEYYRRQHYGRLISRGPSGQKLTREARYAAFSSHCVEVDAPCCHPRLLVQKLRDAGLWDEQKYSMLALVVLHCNSWCQCLATYSDYTVMDAKVELIRIFYGGRPSIEAPFLLKLCDEVQRAAVALLRTPEASWFSDLYGDRPNPEFSRLSAMLSFEEAKLLQIMRSRLEDQVQVLIFDGCYIEYCDIDLVAVTEEDGCISAKDFNDQMMYASHRAVSEGYRMIVQNDINLVGLKNSAEVRFCHQVQSDGGHWWGINFMTDSQVMIVDSECNGRRLITDFDSFIRLASTMQNMTWFRLDIRPRSWIHPDQEAYNLRGAGPLKRPAGRGRRLCQSKAGFTKNFLAYHAALQFRGGLSVHAISYAQKEALWQDSNEHVRWRQEYSAAQLYFNVLCVAETMHDKEERETLLKYMHQIDIANPLSDEFMTEYTRWWRANVCSEEEAALMKDIVIDGHEKVSSKCAHAPPKHAGRVHPGTGLIIGLREMIDPENNNIAVNVLNDVAYMLPNLDCVIYDRMCSCMKAASQSHALKSIRYWCIDKFHAYGHSDGCVCSPLVHNRLATRLRAVNTSIAEQTFKWFRGYASTFNTMSRTTHLFYVFLYVQKHNEVLALETPFLLHTLLLLEEAVDFQTNMSQELALEVLTSAPLRLAVSVVTLINCLQNFLGTSAFVSVLRPTIADDAKIVQSLRDYTRRDANSGAADLLQQRRHKPVSRWKLPSAAAWQKAMDIAASATARWLKRLRDKATAAEEVTPDKNQAKAARASDANMEGAEEGANAVDVARRKLLAGIAIDLDPDAGFQTIFAALSTCKREAVTVTEAKSTGIGKLVRRLRDSSKVAPMKALAGELLTAWLSQNRENSDGTVDPK